MSARETTKDLQSILEQQASIDAGLFTEKDVLRYINRLCVSLDEEGFVTPPTFTIGRLLRAIEEEVLPALKALAETRGAPSTPKKLHELLGKVVGAIKGAIQKGVARANTKLRQHHSTKASAALDTASSPTTAPHVADKAAKAYAKHYVKATALAQKLNPEKHAELTKKKATAGDPAHGSAADAKLNLSRAKSREPELNYHKAMAPHQAATAVDLRAASARRASSAGKSNGAGASHPGPAATSDSTNPGFKPKDL